MLTPCAANDAMRSWREPGLLCAVMTSEVRSLPEGPASWDPSTRKRVRFLGSSSIEGARNLLRKPAVALGEGLRVRIDLAYRLDRGALRHQVLLHAQHHLRADLQGRREQQIERAADRAVAGVFHGDDRVLRGPRLGGAEHVVDRGAGLRFDVRAELLAQG